MVWKIYPNNEEKIIEKIIRSVKDHYADKDVWILKVHGGGYQRPGVPDLLLCIDGRLLAIEAKHRKPSESDLAVYERVTFKQMDEMKKLTKAGATVGVVFDEETLNQVLEKFDNK